MIRSAHARWEGGFPAGAGTISTESKTLDGAQYSFKTRFESGVGTNPEELIAAAHAGCFSMALTVALVTKGFKPESVESDAKLTLEQIDGNWTISHVLLVTKASVPDIDNSTFQAIAADAKANCPVSKVLNAKIDLEASLA